jgi:cytoskeletal protein CcmA (bactofilin family)
MSKWWEKEREKDAKNRSEQRPPSNPQTTLPRIEETSPALEGTSPAAPVTPHYFTEERVEKVMTETTSKTSSSSSNSQHQTYLGGSVVLKGELTGSEDLTIDGQFEGTINLKDCSLTIGQHGQVKADITAKQVVVSGKLDGKINAREKIDIRRTGNVVGDLVSAGVAIEDGAYFKGSIEILRDEEKKTLPRAAATAYSS